MGQPLSATAAAVVREGVAASSGVGIAPAGELPVIRRLVADLLDMVFPPRCAACRCDLSGHHSPASAGGRLCAPCAVELGHAAMTVLDRGAVDGYVALGPYAGLLRESVLRCKRPGAAGLAAALAALMVERHEDTIQSLGVDLVAPVPMHWLRRAVRGVDAPVELARGLARSARLPVAEILVRRRATVMQNRLPVAARRGNLAGAFVVRGDVAGRRVLLVDDVMTTGATLLACREALRDAGAVGVFAAVVARAETTDG